MNAKWIITAGLIATLHGTAFGQSSAAQTTGFWEGSGYTPPWEIPGGYGYGYGSYSGTYEGSVLNGLGAFARGAGEYNYYTAMAARELEEARTLAIKNHKVAVENWHSLRRAHLERRQAEWDAEKLTPEQIAHVVKVSRPDRLTPAQYEPATGKLTWPASLMGAEFAAERAQVEEAFAKRTAKDAGPDSAFYDEVRGLTEKMLGKLRQKTSEMSSLQFIAGKKFLMGLKYESHTPSDLKALVASE